MGWVFFGAGATGGSATGGGVTGIRKFCGCMSFMLISNSGSFKNPLYLLTALPHSV